MSVTGGVHVAELKTATSRISHHAEVVWPYEMSPPLPTHGEFVGRVETFDSI